MVGAGTTMMTTNSESHKGMVLGNYSALSLAKMTEFEILLCAGRALDTHSASR
jgi:hypothetical protein